MQRLSRTKIRARQKREFSIKLAKSAKQVTSRIYRKYIAKNKAAAIARAGAYEYFISIALLYSPSCSSPTP